MSAASIMSQKFFNTVRGLLLSFPRKRESDFFFQFPGFRVALAIASLPGMTSEFCQRTYGTAHW